MRQIIIHHHSFKPLFYVLVGMLLLLPAGCINDDYSNLPNTDSDEYVPVHISFGGIETLFGPFGEEARNVQYNKIHETQDFERNQMLETLVMAEPDTLRPPLTRTDGSLTNATVRLVVYDETNRTYKGTGVYNIDASGTVTASSTEPLTLKPGSYVFHCFTPAQSITISGNNVSVNLPAAGGTTDPAFYYAKTDNPQTISASDYVTGATITLPTLKPQYCKLVLSVSHYKGTATTYTSARVTTTLYREASLALPSGTVTSTSPTSAYVPTYVSSSNPTIYVYSGSTGSFKMLVVGLTVGNVSIGNITTETNTTGMKMDVGNAYKVSLSIIKKNYIKISELPFKVARGNLLYNSTSGRWLLAPDQGYYYKAYGGYETLSANVTGYGNKNDRVYSYFNWGVRAKNPKFAGTYSGPYADKYGGTSSPYYGTTFGYNSTAATSASTDVSNYSNNNDPCYAALGGKWHLPTGGSTSSDIGRFGTITANTSKTGSYQQYITQSNLSSTGTRVVYGHYFGTGVQPSTAQQDKFVFLPSAGGRFADSMGTINKEGSSGSTRYWSSTVTPSFSNGAYDLQLEKSGVGTGTSASYNYTGNCIRCVSFE